MNFEEAWEVFLSSKPECVDTSKPFPMTLDICKMMCETFYIKGGDDAPKVAIMTQSSN